MGECPNCGAIEGVRMKEHQSIHKWRYCQWCSQCGAFYDGKVWRKPKGG